MTRMRGSTSKDLGRRAFGTAGGWKTPGETPARSGEVIDLPMSRVWKPRAGRIYNFPVRTIPDEK
jgi:hypothetical protein